MFFFIFSLIWLQIFANLTFAQEIIDFDENNYFVLLSSSKFYFNYRQTGNALVLYKYLKSRGVKDDRILLVLPENHACNARNKYRGNMKYFADDTQNFYCDDVEVDFKADDLTFESILNMLRGRYSPSFPENKKLKTNEKSKIFIYFNGHGGDTYFKIQDTEVMQSMDLAKVYDEMHKKRKYESIFMIMDTCEAQSLFDDIKAPNLILLASSAHHENSLSHEWSDELNTHLNDHFIYEFSKFINTP